MTHDEKIMDIDVLEDKLASLDWFLQSVMNAVPESRLWLRPFIDQVRDVKDSTDSIRAAIERNRDKKPIVVDLQEVMQPLNFGRFA